ncbi:hypothetical protein V1477_020607 [Vespula maculifrons]|uniref:Uncharacterized protein n=1 Tax=Vespula maculifrons TaxID=7453 RepID=A0ABD2AMD8_VESMC
MGVTNRESEPLFILRADKETNEAPLITGITLAHFFASIYHQGCTYRRKSKEEGGSEEDEEDEDEKESRRRSRRFGFRISLSLSLSVPLLLACLLARSLAPWQAGLVSERYISGLASQWRIVRIEATIGERGATLINELINNGNVSTENSAGHVTERSMAAVVDGGSTYRPVVEGNPVSLPTEVRTELRECRNKLTEILPGSDKFITFTRDDTVAVQAAIRWRLLTRLTDKPNRENSYPGRFYPVP